VHPKDNVEFAEQYELAHFYQIAYRLFVTSVVNNVNFVGRHIYLGCMRLQ